MTPLDARAGTAEKVATPSALYPCPLCGLRTTVIQRGCRDRRGFATVRFDVLRCEGCGVAFLWPRPAADELARLYADDYHSHADGAARRSRLTRALKAACLWPYRLRFGSESGTHRPFGQARLLDVGCGTGEYLAAMAALGWECVGCDLSPRALVMARRRVPRAILVEGTPEEVSDHLGPFELITLWHTLEHLPDPRGSLTRLRSLLTPEGRLVVAVPNVGSPEARVLGARWLEIDIPAHLFFFSIRTLTDLLESVGFEPIRVRPQVHPSTVSEALGFVLDDLVGAHRAKPRPALYHLLFPVATLSYALGNWSCVEVTARRR